MGSGVLLFFWGVCRDLLRLTDLKDLLRLRIRRRWWVKDCISQMCDIGCKDKVGGDWVSGCLGWLFSGGCFEWVLLGSVHWTQGHGAGVLARLCSRIAYLRCAMQGVRIGWAGIRSADAWAGCFRADALNGAFGLSALDTGSWCRRLGAALLVYCISQMCDTRCKDRVGGDTVGGCLGWVSSGGCFEWVLLGSVHWT